MSDLGSDINLTFFFVSSGFFFYFFLSFIQTFFFPFFLIVFTCVRASECETCFYSYRWIVFFRYFGFFFFGLCFPVVCVREREKDDISILLVYLKFLSPIVEKSVLYNNIENYTKHVRYRDPSDLVRFSLMFCSSSGVLVSVELEVNGRITSRPMSYNCIDPREYIGVSPTSADIDINLSE